jgi:hypothetical protein
MRLLVVFFLLYGGIQAYLAHAVNHAFALVGPARLLVWLAALLLTLSPLLLWQLERNPGAGVVSVGIAWIVFCWMGYAFLFFWLGLGLNLYELAARLAGLPMLAARHAFLALAMVTLAVWLHGFNSAGKPRVERVSIESGKLPHDFPGLRIVQISDVHLGMLIGRRSLDRILEQVAALQPDVLVSTGDLVDAEAAHLDGLSSRLAAYRPRLGKFAVTGNHEAYVGLEHALDFHRRAGFQLLRGETMELAGMITLAGVDDPAVLAGASDETRVLAGIPADRFVLLLKHQPVVAPGGRFDLQLSGHTHRGQIFPFDLLVRRAYPMIEGLSTLPDGRQVYVSRGTGTWGPPIRVLAPPEITLIELKAPRSQAAAAAR